MPTFGSIDGIKINIYFIEHLPPHIHALYNEYEVLLRIRDGSIYEGHFPTRQLKKTQIWLNEHRAEALKTFYELNPHLTNEKRAKKPPKNTKDK